MRSGLEKFSRDRSSTGAALVVMTIVLFVVSFVFILQGMSAFLVEKVQEGVDVSAFFQDEVSEEAMLQVREQLLVQREVKEVEYVSKEEALRRFIEIYQGKEAILAPLDALGRNPLHAHLNVKARDPDEYTKITEFLSQEAFLPLIASVDFYERAPVIAKLSLITSGIRAGVLAISIALSAIAVLVAFNTIRLTIYNSKEEIEIMRLVGASSWFIRGPFLVQGVLVGMAASVGTIALLFVLSFFARGQVQSFSGFDVFSFLVARFFWFLLLQFLVGIGLGLASAAIAINRYLKV
mgnify:CR=1 FL=1